MHQNQVALWLFPVPMCVHVQLLKILLCEREVREALWSPRRNAREHRKPRHVSSIVFINGYFLRRPISGGLISPCESCNRRGAQWPACQSRCPSSGSFLLFIFDCRKKFGRSAQRGTARMRNQRYSLVFPFVCYINSRILYISRVRSTNNII